MKDVLESSKRLRRKMILWRFLIWLFIFAFFVVGFIGIFYIPVFRIENISVEGASFLSTDDIFQEVKLYITKKYLGIIPRDNIFVFRKDDVIFDLQKKFPRIKTISVHKFFPKELKIKLTERNMAAVWCAVSEKETCAFLDEDGVIFAKAPFFSGLALFKLRDERAEKIFSLGEAILPDNFLKDIFAFRDLTKKELGKELSSVDLKPDGVFELNAIGGWKIVINDRINLRDAFDNLKVAFKSSIESREEPLEYIDLRFGNKVFYKFK